MIEIAASKFDAKPRPPVSGRKKPISTLSRQPQVSLRGYQPNSSDLCELLQIARPAVRNRLEYLVEKNFLKAPPGGSERRYGFVGVKFLAYQVDPQTEEITSEQEYDLGDYVVTFKKKKGA